MIVKLASFLTFLCIGLLFGCCCQDSFSESQQKKTSCIPPEKSYLERSLRAPQAREEYDRSLTKATGDKFRHKF